MKTTGFITKCELDPKNGGLTVPSSSILGDTKVAVIGMKSAELGNLLPRRSTIDGFDKYEIILRHLPKFEIVWG